jgi:hypothetical protein
LLHKPQLVVIPVVPVVLLVSAPATISTWILATRVIAEIVQALGVETVYATAAIVTTLEQLDVLVM